MNADASLCLLDEHDEHDFVDQNGHMTFFFSFFELLLYRFTLLFLSLWDTISHHSMKPAFREPWYTSVKYRTRTFSYMSSFRHILIPLRDISECLIGSVQSLVTKLLFLLKNTSYICFQCFPRGISRSYTLNHNSMGKKNGKTHNLEFRRLNPTNMLNFFSFFLTLSK